MLLIAETKQLLQENVSHLTEREEVSEKFEQFLLLIYMYILGE